MANTITIEQSAGFQRWLRAGLLALDVLVLGIIGLRFHPHLVWGGIWMVVSASALTVSMVDYLRQSSAFETRIIITATILCLSIGFLLRG